MVHRTDLSASMEDYLEAVDALRREKGVARVRDISAWLGVKSSSVNSALGVLVDKGYVVHERYGYVDLTAEGQTLARDIQSRHDTLMQFLIEILAIDKKTAAADACKMEHAISPQTFAKLKKFVRRYKNK